MELALETCDASERHDEHDSSRFSLPASVAGLSQEDDHWMEGRVELALETCDA